MAIYQNVKNGTWFFSIYISKAKKRLRGSCRTKDKKEAEAFEAVLRAGAIGTPLSQKAKLHKIVDALFDDEDDNNNSDNIELQFIKEDLDRCNKILGAKPSERLEYWRGQEIKRFLIWVSDYTNCKRLQDIDRRTAQSYALYVGKGKSSKTVQEIIGCLLAIWNTLARGHDNLENPWKLAMPKYVEKNRREEFTREEVGRIVKVADEVKGGWEIACRIALCTGLRFGDIVNLLFWTKFCKYDIIDA